eukprot:COSAG06_NODE_15662_length_1054_cov_1.479581_2_plen_108_part_00
MLGGWLGFGAAYGLERGRVVKVGEDRPALPWFSVDTVAAAGVHLCQRDRERSISGSQPRSVRLDGRRVVRTGGETGRQTSLTASCSLGHSGSLLICFTINWHSLHCF